jgi:glycosyltransferase involved in cell wall biosynthesis
MQFGGLRTKGIVKKYRENMPLITVITVVYNGEKTLEETILSVVNQTYKSIEYIIIDGNSTDRTVDIIKDYDRRIKNGEYPNIFFKWISEPDNGIYDAMNKGIDIATGEWINFMNSGDSFYTITIIEEIFTTYINAGVIYGNTYKIYSHFSRVEKPSELRKIKKALPFCHQSSFINYEFIKNKFDLKYKYVADDDLFYKLYKNNVKFVFIDIIIAKYEGSYGFSSSHVKNSLYENYIIRGGKSYFLWYFFVYIPLIIRHKVSQKYFSLILKEKHVG